MPVAQSRSEAPPCRNKAKNAVTLSADEEVQLAGDQKLLTDLLDLQSEDVKDAVANKQAVNVGNENGESSIHMAVKGLTRHAVATNTISNDMSILDLLVKEGAFVDYSDSSGKKPLHLCFDADDKGVVFADYLLALVDGAGERVIDLGYINVNTGNTLLHDCAWAGNVECMRMLLKTGAFEGKLEILNKQGQTPLHCASFRAPAALVDILVKAGADFNAVEKNPRALVKETPVMMAEKMGRTDTAELLKSLGVTLTAVSAAAKLRKPKKAAAADAA